MSRLNRWPLIFLRERWFTPNFFLRSGWFTPRAQILIMTATKQKKINVGIYIPKKELEEMRAAARVDLSGPAVLAMARKGLEAEKSERMK